MPMIVDERRGECFLCAGAIVYLKSGSPALTVVDVGRDTGLVFVRWQISQGEIGEASFHSAMLSLLPVTCQA